MHMLIQGGFDFNDQVRRFFVILSGSEESHGIVQ
jgi:methionine synthase II (cobalamin-independent)